MNENEIQKIFEEIMAIDEKYDFDLTKADEKDKQDYLNKVNSILESNPSNCDALYWKALFYQSLGEFDKAIALFEKILSINPENHGVKENLKDCKEIQKWAGEKETRQSFSLPNNDSNILEKIPCEYILVLKLVIIIIILFTCFQPLVFSGNDKKVLKAAENSGTNSFETLNVNPVSEYNYLTKREIYNLRKKYVKDSLFASSDYEPNEGVFGGIVDRKPWWGTSPCSELNYKGDYHERIEGKSKVSAQVNNPNALVGVSVPYSPWSYEDNQEFCRGEYSKFLPKSIYYDSKDNLIIAKYKVTKKFTKYRTNVNGMETRYPLQLSGLNAIDFGYKYAYAFDTKNIDMLYSENNNINNDIKTFNDYLHLGYSCKYEGGCNNISPMQNDKMFTVYSLPAEINLKLWKKEPLNKYMKADMYYKIIFDE